MKELTKKVLESGLIDKPTATLMERWGQLDPGASDLTDEHKLTGALERSKDERFIRQTLEDFVEELELLIQPEALERYVTKLDCNRGGE